MKSEMFLKVFFKYEVKYRVIFETSYGKVIFDDKDEKDDSDIDQVFESIASRVAKNVSNSFKEPR
jgi:hypothetical protein